MLAYKSGDLVVLKSGGPVMTIDTVNTDIFDDNKITGLLCVWFVGNKLERVRFDHRAIDAADLHTVAAKRETREEAPGEYTAVLDDMVGAMNDAADQPKASQPKAARPVLRRRKTPRPATTEHAPPPGS
jgi:uncharacterized protein YodC (DUF2158 family)